MFSNRCVKCVSILPALVLVAAAQSAQAQTVKLDEITVTANKRDQQLSRVDGAVSVQSAEQLERAEVKTVSDLEKVFPGLVIRQRGNRVYSNFTVRGMSSPDFYNPTVQVYVDGVPQSDAFLTQDLVNVERIEFLRGPQGTLYGRNAYGGVINIVTRQPRRNGVSGGATVTNRTQSGDLNATGAFDDRWFADIAVRGYGNRGQITDPTTGNKVDTSQTWNGKAQLRYAPVNGPFDAAFYVARDALRSREEIYVNDAQINQRLYPVGVPYPYLIRDVTSSALSWNYAFGPFKLTSISSFQDVNVDRELFGTRSPETTRSWSEEARIAYDAGGPLTGVAGLYYQDTEFARRQLTGLLRTNAVNTQATAVFGEFTYALTPRLALTAGVRGSFDEAQVSYRGAFNFDNAASFTSVQPKISLGYQVTDETRVYALVSRGYKPGGFNHAVSTPADSNPYLPESATNYELGARNAFWGGRFTLAVTGYHIDSKDKQIYVGVVPNMVIRNVGAASSTGVEVETTLRATEWLTLTGSFTYGVSRFDDYVDPFTKANFTGNRVPYAPDVTLHAGFRQVVPQSWWAGELALSGTVHYFGQTYFDEANSLGQPAYATIDAGIEAELRKGVVFKVFGTNLTDEIYRTYSYRAGPSVFSNIAQGRLVGVSLRSSF
jgi:pesticin/yersiniabactin receptor